MELAEPLDLTESKQFILNKVLVQAIRLLVCSPNCQFGLQRRRPDDPSSRSGKIDPGVRLIVNWVDQLGRVVAQHDWSTPMLANAGTVSQ